MLLTFAAMVAGATASVAQIKLQPSARTATGPATPRATTPALPPAAQPSSQTPSQPTSQGAAHKGARGRILEQASAKVVSQELSGRNGGETLTVSGLAATVWQPSRAAFGRMPLVVNMHAAGACNTESSFLMRALAEEGYLVVAPRHADARCAAAAGSPGSDDRRSASASAEQDERARLADVFRLLTGLERDPDWAARIDWSRVAFVGHGAGACAALKLSASRQVWPPGGADIKAVLAMEPSCPRVKVGNALGSAVVPTMLLDGAPQFMLNALTRKQVRSVRHSLGKTTFVTLANADDAAWTDPGSPAQHELIVRQVRQFLGTHLSSLKDSISTKADGPGQPQRK